MADLRIERDGSDGYIVDTDGARVADVANKSSTLALDVCDVLTSGRLWGGWSATRSDGSPGFSREWIYLTDENGSRVATVWLLDRTALRLTEPTP